MMPDSAKKTVLVCPIDWGIGHAARCVPLIREMTGLGLRVVIAASGRSLEFLKKEFPEADFHEFPGKKVTYPRKGRMALRMLRIFPSLLVKTWQEHNRLRQIAEQSGAGLIISDNRYGCWHSTIPSVFMTHQLEIQTPPGLKWLKPLIQRINYRFIRHYKECWIPDFELHRGLAGSLSHPLRMPENAHYVGILSRFAFRQDYTDEAGNQRFDLLVMLSGPEPQRSILEEKILMQLVNIDFQVAMVRGMTETDEAFVLDGRIHVFSHLGTGRMKELISNSDLVICRSGYSSIMDLVTLGKRAIFIPTPGQTEQEYLAKYLMEKKIYFSMEQEKFDLCYAVEMSKNFPGMVIRNDHKALITRIKSLI